MRWPRVDVVFEMVKNYNLLLLRRLMRQWLNSSWNLLFWPPDVVRQWRDAKTARLVIGQWLVLRPKSRLYTPSDGPSIEIHTLHWPDADPRLAEHQQLVFDALALPLNRHVCRIDHGLWLNAVLQSATAEVVVFVDNDCIPLQRGVVERAARFADQQQSFVGIAQCSNHIPGAGGVFAAPAFLAVSRQAWHSLGRPDLRASRRCDVAEELSRAAEAAGLRYQAIHPTSFERAGQWGVYALGAYGPYGIGTVFGGCIFHLYEGRSRQNVDLFVQQCQKVLTNQQQQDQSLTMACASQWW